VVDKLRVSPGKKFLPALDFPVSDTPIPRIPSSSEGWTVDPLQYAASQTLYHLTFKAESLKRKSAWVDEVLFSNTYSSNLDAFPCLSFIVITVKRN